MIAANASMLKFATPYIHPHGCISGFAPSYSHDADRDHQWWGSAAALLRFVEHDDSATIWHKDGRYMAAASRRRDNKDCRRIQIASCWGRPGDQPSLLLRGPCTKASLQEAI
jgi:hypothetical protein